MRLLVTRHAEADKDAFASRPPWGAMLEWALTASQLRRLAD